MQDPNWLLSSAAQSAAAFVAIIAGFIATRVLGLSAERAGVKSLLADTHATLQFQRGRLAEQRRRLRDMDVSAFIDESLDRIVESRGEIPLADLVEDGTATGRTKEELQPSFDKTVATVKEAFQLFLVERPFQDEPPDEMTEYLRSIGVNVNLEERHIYERVYWKSAEIWSAQRRKRSSRRLFGALDIGPSPVVLPTNLNIPGQESVRLANDLHEECSRLEAECGRLELQERQYEERLRGLGKPEGLTVGLAALLYCAVTGIFVPIALMPMAVGSLAVWQKFGVTALFVSGVSSVIGYLFWSVRRLSS